MDLEDRIDVWLLLWKADHEAKWIRLVGIDLDWASSIMQAVHWMLGPEIDEVLTSRLGEERIDSRGLVLHLVDKLTRGGDVLDAQLLAVSARDQNIGPRNAIDLAIAHLSVGVLRCGESVQDCVARSIDQILPVLRNGDTRVRGWSVETEDEW